MPQHYQYRIDYNEREGVRQLRPSPIVGALRDDVETALNELRRLVTQPGTYVQSATINLIPIPSCNDYIVMPHGNAEYHCDLAEHDGQHEYTETVGDGIGDESVTIYWD